MFLLAIVATIIITYVTFYSYKFHKIKSKFDRHGIPYKKAWPILGNLGQAMLERKCFRDTAMETYKLHPEAKYVGYFCFNKSVIMLRDIDLIKSVTIKNVESFIDHRSIMGTDIDPFFGTNLFNLKGQKWLEARSVLSPAFTTHKMKLSFEQMLECGSKFVKDLATLAAPEGKEFEMKELLSKFGHDVVASFALGVTVDSMENPKNELYVLNKKAAHFEGILSLKVLLYQNFNWIMKLLRVKSFSKRHEKIFVDIVEDSIRTRDEKGISKPDFIQLFMEKRNTPKELNLLEMSGHAFGMFFAAFDTSVSQFSFMAYEIAVNPEIQKRLQKEIDDAYVENKGVLTYDVVNRLPLLDAVVNESVRIYSPSPLTDRICNKQFELPPCLPGAKPYTVNVGDILWVPIAPLMLNPDHFDEPEKFKPERFLNKKIPMNQAPYMPFGQGPRMCIGNRFALLEMKVIAVQMLLRCDLRPCSKTNIPMKFSSSSLVLYSKGGFWLKVVPRQETVVQD